VRELEKIGFGVLRTPNPIFSIFPRPQGRLFEEKRFDFNILLSHTCDKSKRNLRHCDMTVFPNSLYKEETNNRIVVYNVYIK
jgi:hypothetical protein